VDAIINTGISVPATEGIAFWFWDLLQGWFLPLNPFHTALLSTTAIIFFGILLLDSIFGRRLWCRVLCPLGAFLGLFSHISPFGRKVDPECTECALCETDCRMGAIEDNFFRTRRSECILCLECKEVCAIESTTYTWHKQEGGQESFNFDRRRVLGIMGVSIVFGGIMRTQLRSRFNDAYLIRPPGAVEENKFLDICLRCEECVKACSSTGACLQPAGVDYGWSGFWSPRANMRAGYCEYSCILCGQVCPSGAIKLLTEEVKQKQVIGLGMINTTTCIPWATGVDCIVCEEHCPTPKKAILFRLGAVTLLDGVKEGVKLPYVDTSLCIGCGICETKCPVVGESAIRVTNEGQQRES
jgi:ferredoxin